MTSFLRAFADGLSPPQKRLIFILVDAALLILALWLSYTVRLGGWTPPSQSTQLLTMLSAPLITVPILYWMGIYKAVVRHLTERSLWQIVQAMTLAAICWVGFSFIISALYQGFVPRSVLILYWALGILLLCASRLGAKALLGGARASESTRRIGIYGADADAVSLKKILDAEPGTRVSVFFSEDENLIGRTLNGAPVVPPARLNEAISHHGISEIIISQPTLTLGERQALVEQIGVHGIPVRTLPPLGAVATGEYAVNQIRDFDVDELLGRSSVPPDPQLLGAAITDKVVLVTGAGGSIGSELCRTVLPWGPRRLILVEANEYALYRIEQSLASLHLSTEVVPVLGSAGDSALMRRVIAAQDVEVVYHAAAHKHVPLLEANALEGIRNNVMGTLALAREAFVNKVDTFVLISSDKAVRPTNVMGATKRWAELIVQSFAERARREGTGQHFSSIRFGNVLGSTGSVVPLFRGQIAKGGPITLTDTRMTRYFMSIHEAAELIVQAGALAEGGDVFLLEMGEPIRIIDLAETMVRLAGLRVTTEEARGDIEIKLIGARPGEKLHEELFYDPARAQPTRHPRILRSIEGDENENQLRDALGTLQAALDNGDEPRAREVLFGLLKKIPVTA